MKIHKRADNIRGQVTIFIIIAILLVVGVVLFFVFKDSIIEKKIPLSLEPVHKSFLYCIEKETLLGIDFLEGQAGYIDPPEFESGSSYAPFSNQLDFLGNPVPYWYYVSGNGLQKEQVPSLKNMEDQLGDFIEERILSCDLDSYTQSGFKVIKGENPKASITIHDGNVLVSLDMDLNIEKGEDKVLVSAHNLEVKSYLGDLYNSAKKVYDYEQSTLFLENYAVDNLRLYAPVDGVEITCSPKTWIIDDVFDDMQEAIESNTLALKLKNSPADLNSADDKYFIVDLETEGDVRFMSSKNWPYSFEVQPSNGPILLEEPVGNQQGLGLLGFCYVPYHFVYNVAYPVLIQVQKGDEIFQFPVAVVLRGNRPREPISSSAIGSQLPEICEYKNTPVGVKTYNQEMNSVEADISYECFGVTCDIGKTTLGYLQEDFPQCVNGFVIATAEGYKDSRYLFSTNEGGELDIFMDKLYELDLKLQTDGRDYADSAIVSFVSEDYSTTIAYPEQNKVKLAEGQYEIQVYIYRESSIDLSSLNYKKCVDVPSSGIGGLFGFTTEKCYDFEIPGQTISNALAGGGKQNYYILESDLKSASRIEINSAGLSTPRTIEDLQKNYILFDENGLEVDFA